MIIEHFLEWMHSAPVPERAQAVNALARAFLFSQMSEHDRLTAQCAMTVLLDDPSTRVRFALADALASAKHAPRNVIMALANDSAEISTMILSRSPIFSDGELVDLMAGGSVEQQIAISCRGSIAPALCGGIGEVGVVEACLGLLFNKAAKPSKNVLMRIAERHGANTQIRQKMLADKSLDADIRILLVEKLGNQLGEFVSTKKWLPKARANKSVKNALDRSSILNAAMVDDGQVDLIVSALIKSHRLTTSFLLRAICMGNITLFCASLGKLSGIPTRRIEAMISQNRHSAFRAAFAKSGMPPQTYDVFFTAISVWKSLLSQPDWMSRARMPYLVTGKMLEKYKGNHDNVVDDLLLLLQQISADVARDEARLHVDELTRKRVEAEEQRLNEEVSAVIEAELIAAVEDMNDHENDDFDEQFFNEFEDNISKAFEREIIEISENDMKLPEKADNDSRDSLDSPINRREAQTLPVLEASLMSKAA